MSKVFDGMMEAFKELGKLEGYSDEYFNLIEDCIEENYTSETIDESTNSKICCICKEPYEGYGNNAEPVCSGVCCDKCNIERVIPMRFKMMTEAIQEPIRTWLLITDSKDAVTVSYRKRTKDFAINTTNPDWVIGDCRLRFLTEEDANRFAEFFVAQGGASSCKVSPSRTLREVVKIEKASVYDVPCPADIPLYVSTNFLEYRGIDKTSMIDQSFQESKELNEEKNSQIPGQISMFDDEEFADDHPVEKESEIGSSSEIDLAKLVDYLEKSGFTKKRDNSQCILEKCFVARKHSIIQTIVIERSINEIVGRLELDHKVIYGTKLESLSDIENFINLDNVNKNVDYYLNSGKRNISKEYDDSINKAVAKYGETHSSSNISKLANYMKKHPAYTTNESTALNEAELSNSEKLFRKFPELRKPATEEVEEVITEALSDYKITYYLATATKERRPETREDIDHDYKEVHVDVDKDFDALTKAFMIQRGIDNSDLTYELDDHNIQTEEDFIDYFNDTDWGDGSIIMLKVEGPNGVVYDTGYDKQTFIDNFEDNLAYEKEMLADMEKEDPEMAARFRELLDIKESIKPECVDCKEEIIEEVDDDYSFDEMDEMLTEDKEIQRFRHMYGVED